jgi:hypothetical protein
MWRWLKWLVLTTLAIAILIGGLVYLFGPHGEVARALAQFKTAYDARDGTVVASLTAPAELSLFDAHRKQALTGSREAVAALPFRSRAEVLSLRSQVQKGTLPVAVLTDPDLPRAYAGYIDHQPPSRAEMPGSILFAVPTGRGQARGYLEVAPSAGMALLRGLIILTYGVYYGFEKTGDGWRIDRTPALDRAARENEHWAVSMEPTGNRFIYQLLGAQDAETQDRLWQPLEH